MRLVTTGGKDFFELVDHIQHRTVAYCRLDRVQLLERRAAWSQICDVQIRLLALNARDESGEHHGRLAAAGWAEHRQKRIVRNLPQQHVNQRVAAKEKLAV